MRDITTKEVRNSLKELKGGQSPEEDQIVCAVVSKRAWFPRDGIMWFQYLSSTRKVIKLTQIIKDH